MHKLAVTAVVDHCRKRVASGDCQKIAALPAEVLEDAILELAREPMQLLVDKDWIRRGIERDGDTEPEAGELHPEQANNQGNRTNPEGMSSG